MIYFELHASNIQALLGPMPKGNCIISSPVCNTLLLGMGPSGVYISEVWSSKYIAWIHVLLMIPLPMGTGFLYIWSNLGHKLQRVLFSLVFCFLWYRCLWAWGQGQLSRRKKELKKHVTNTSIEKTWQVIPGWENLAQPPPKSLIQNDQ